MIVALETFEEFALYDPLVGPAENEWTEYPFGGSSFDGILEDRDGFKEAFVSNAAGTHAVLTYNGPNVQSISDCFIRVHNSGFAGTFEFGYVFRYGPSGGLAFYKDGAQMRLISFSTSDPFSSPVVEANLDAYVGHISTIVWISVEGSTVKIYLNGELMSTTTVSHLTAGKIGVISKDPNGWWFADIAAENFSSGMMAPTDLAATIISSTSIQLTWTNNAPDTGQILIEKKIGTGSWAQIDTAPASATSYIDEDADCNVLNTYRIRAADNYSLPVVLYRDHFKGTIGDAVTGWTPSFGTFLYGPSSTQAVMQRTSGVYTMIQSDAFKIHNTYRRLQIKIDEMGTGTYTIRLQFNGTPDYVDLAIDETATGVFDYDIIDALETEGYIPSEYNNAYFHIEVWLSERMVLDFVKVYRTETYDNEDVCYFQDFFEDTDYTAIEDHTPDINRTGSTFNDPDSYWEILNDYLTCNSLPDDSLTLDLKRKSFKLSVYVLVENLIDPYDYKITVDQKYNFHISSGGITLLIDDVVYLLWDPTFTFAVGETLVEIEVNPLFISLTVGSDEYRFYSTQTPSTIIGIGSTASTALGLKNLILQVARIFSAYSSEVPVTITSLTVQEIWERYSEMKFERGIYIKRINSAGVYESEWQNVVDLVGFETRLYKLCSNIQYALPNNTYSLGAVTINNASLLFANQSGQLSNEDAPNSIFKNYVRHKSLIKIVDSFIDAYSYPGSYGKVDTTTFEGFIDDRLCVTKTDDTENIIATDILGTLLKSVTLADLSLTTNQTIQNTVYELMNRSIFTDFFTVSIGNIVPGFDATNLDLTQYDQSTTAFEFLQNLSVGHSVFYVKDSVFYYKSDDPGVSSVLDLWETPQRKIKFDKFNSGGNVVFDKLYWQDAVAVYEASDLTYNQSYAFSISGIGYPTQRQGLLDYAGPRLSVRKISFELSIPFLPILFILDRITILHRGTLQEGCFILDISKLDEGSFLEPVGAFTIEATDNWKIVSINHKTNNQTILRLEKIL